MEPHFQMGCECPGGLCMWLPWVRKEWKCPDAGVSLPLEAF
jgi:hypothetical protein